MKEVESLVDMGSEGGFWEELDGESEGEFAVDVGLNSELASRCNDAGTWDVIG
jgi:hypothetical protein